MLTLALSTGQHIAGLVVLAIVFMVGIGVGEERARMGKKNFW